MGIFFAYICRKGLASSSLVFCEAPSRSPMSCHPAPSNSSRSAVAVAQSGSLVQYLLQHINQPNFQSNAYDVCHPCRGQASTPFCLQKHGVQALSMASTRKTAALSAQERA